MFARVARLAIPATLLAACAHHSPPAVAPAPAAETATAAAPASTSTPPATTDLAAGAASTAARTALTQMTFFEFGKSDLTDQSQEMLSAKVAILAANPGIAIRVDGDCDERGSDEYNLALGQRRAQAAKRYLVEQGISADRIATISYGNERPISHADTEAGWAENRNDQFEITAGGGAIRAPQGN